MRIAYFFLISISYLQACSPMKQGANMKVVSIENILDKNVAGHEICDSFILTKEDVVKYFSIAEQVDEYEFHHEAIILPCKYQGLIEIDDELLQWEIMAGGAGYLYKDQRVDERYLCKGNCCNDLPNLC